MRNLFKVKAFIQQLYSQYGTQVEAGLKFVLSLVTVLMLNANIGSMAIFKNPVVVLGIAVICAVVPKNLMTIILSLAMVAQGAGLSVEIAALMLILLIIMYLFYFRLASGDSWVLVLQPILFVLNIPFVMPLVLGLVGSPFSIVSMACGIVMYFLMNYMHVHFDEISASSDGLTAMSDMAKSVFANQAMYMIIIAFAMVLIAVFVIHKLSIEYSWMIAVAAGTVIELVMMIVGCMSFGVGDILSIPAVIIGNIVSVLIGMFVCFMLHHVDYKKKERVQFEDEDYYYYVTAVPKIQTGFSAKKTNSSGKKKNQKRRTGK